MGYFFRRCPQVFLQIVFIVVVEREDGWAIKGAMSSLALSVGDLMVKFAFPLFVKCSRLKPCLSHLLEKKSPVSNGSLHESGEYYV